MGADLYIEPLREAARNQYGTLFDTAVWRRDEMTKEINELNHQLVSLQRKAKKSITDENKIKKITSQINALEEEYSKLQADVEKYFNILHSTSTGYFRDSYNSGSILWLLGLSWWRDMPSGQVNAAQLREALAKIESRSVPRLDADQLKKIGCKVDDAKNSADEWYKWYQKRKAELVDFLKMAIEYAEKGEEVYFST